jgi:hypothetical protein
VAGGRQGTPGSCHPGIEWVTLSHQAKQLKDAFTLEGLQEMQRRMDAIDKKDTLQ